MAVSTGDSRRNETVECRVVRTVPSGLIVALDDGRKGIIRNRELMWTRLLSAEPATFSLGERLQALVLNLDERTGHVELSRKQVLDDPWEKVREGKYHKGQIVKGEVVNLTHDGVYVEIEPGVDGFLPIDQIPRGIGKRTEELLWLSDWVEAVVTELRHDLKRLDLSIIERLDRRSRDQAAKPGSVDLASDVRRQVGFVQPDSKHYTELKQHIGKRIHRICIIDDVSKFAVGLADWLGRLGYEAKTLKGAPLELTDESAFDLYLLDVDLGDADGREIARAILGRSSDARIVLMTALDRIDEHEPLSDDLPLCGILLKPFDYSEVLALLLALETAEPRRINLKDSALGERDQRFLEYVSGHLQAASDSTTPLCNALIRLRTDAEADAAYLLKMDPFSLRVSVTSCSARHDNYLTRSQLDLLKRSVVRNIALNKEVIYEGIASLQGRFESLQHVFSVESCIGVPIPEVSPAEHYALLLLHRDVDHFTPAHLAEAMAISSLLSSYLRQAVLSAIVTRSQRSVLLGQIAASLLHELKNKINTIGQETQNMELDVEELTEKAGSLPARLWAGKITRRLSLMKAEYGDLRTMTLENLGIVGQEHVASVDVGDLLWKVARIIGPVAKTNQVRIQMRLDSHLPCMTTIPLRLEQVFLNVALNAVQQMSLMRLPNCLLQISTSYDEHDTEYPFKVRLIDDGPGIHKPQWNWVFELGTTTRPEGSGLGLFVSKGLVESLGGQIIVEQSYMFMGTTILIKLPLSHAPEVSHVQS